MKGRFEIPVRKRTIYILITIWLIVAAIDSGFRPIAMLTGSWTTSTSTRYGFSIDHPKWWKARQYNGYKNDDTIVYIISSEFNPGFSGIEISRKAAANSTIWDVAEWGSILRQRGGVKLHKGISGFTQGPLQVVEFDGHTVLRRTFKADGLTNEDIYISRTEDMIIITLRTSNKQYEEYLDEFTQIWTSFTPLK